jgi:hypothetical protein
MFKRRNGLGKRIEINTPKVSEASYRKDPFLGVFILKIFIGA